MRTSALLSLLLAGLLGCQGRENLDQVTQDTKGGSPDRNAKTSYGQAAEGAKAVNQLVEGRDGEISEQAASLDDGE